MHILDPNRTLQARAYRCMPPKKRAMEPVCFLFWFILYKRLQNLWPLFQTQCHINLGSPSTSFQNLIRNMLLPLNNSPDIHRMCISPISGVRFSIECRVTKFQGSKRNAPCYIGAELFFKNLNQNYDCSAASLD